MSIWRGAPPIGKTLLDLLAQTIPAVEIFRRDPVRMLAESFLDLVDGQAGCGQVRDHPLKFLVALTIRRTIDNDVFDIVGLRVGGIEIKTAAVGLSVAFVLWFPVILRDKLMD